MSTAKPKVIFITNPGRNLSASDIAEVLGRLSRSDEQWNALVQILQRRLYSATIDASSASITEREAGHAGGRISEISDLMGELASYLDSATK